MNTSLPPSLSASARTDLARRLVSAAPTLARQVAVTGFDGFVDEMISVVGTRSNLQTWTPVPTIAQFGDLVRAAAGRSSLREIVVHRQEAGGCAVNLGDGLAALGVQVDCYATLGTPRSSAFDVLAQRCRHVESWGREPGRTLALEFQDGKLMLSAVQQLQEFTPALLAREIPAGRFRQSCMEASLIALTDWTLYPHMTDCWVHLQQDVFPALRQRPWLFIDLVDPSSRSRDDVRKMLEALPRFEETGPTVLGLNGNEASQVAHCLGIPAAGEAPEEICAQAAAIREKLNIERVVIHLIRRAVSADRNGTAAVEGFHCPSPKKSTGAGDRFNAGYCTGLLLNASPAECLTIGCAASGWFVREARSGSLAEIAGLLQSPIVNDDK